MSERVERPGEIAQTLDRGLQVLEQLGIAPDGMSVTDVADALGVHRSIASRLLATLARRSFVDRRRDGRYLLGYGVLSLARQVSGNISVAAVPLLAEIADRLDATGVLHVVDGDESVTLASVESRGATFRVGLRVGARMPLTVAAHGMAVLAGRDPDDDERPEVTRARRLGYAVSMGEVVPGFVGISAPLFVHGRCDASIGVVVPRERSSEEASLGAEVLTLAEKVSAALE